MATTTTVSIQALTDITNDADYQAPTTDGIWTTCYVSNRYEKDRRRYNLAVTSPGGFQGSSTAFVQTANPTLLWICDWMVVRVGGKPNVPNPTPQDTNWVLLDDWWEPGFVDIGGADGSTLLYHIYGTYVYGHKNPNDHTNLNAAFPLAPWIDQSKVTTSDRTIPDSLYMNGISDVVSTIAKGIAQAQ